ncbi:MAG: hypothetical protein L3J50_08870, partial [Emcibacter sp.]|nr:hypothetical protein [Emcibacter sp.]
MGKIFNSFLAKVTENNLLSHFKYLFVLIILFSGMLSYEVEAADPPSVRVLKGSAISPASAISVLGSTTTHTNSTEAPRHQEIIDLASSLKNDPDLIFEYVYDNVETLPTFGLKNGALGAIIDGKGTAFDQAHLMVEMLRAAGYTAQYRYGTVTLTGSQFTNLFGTTNDRNACELMQAGGFGVTVNGSTNCSALSTSSSGGVVSFNHVWVRALIGSTYYYFDPSVKTQTRISGWNMSSKTGYNSSAFWTDAGVSTGVQGNASYVSNINRTNIETNLTNYSNTLVNNMKAEVNHNTSVTDIAGGIEVEPVTVPSGGYRKAETQLGHALVANQSWSGDMPDQYRTKVDISYSGTTTSFYADDLYGRRLWFYNPVGYTARFMVGKRIRISAIWNGATSISVSINHPYAAMSGTLGDHTEIFNSPFQKGKTAALVLGFGHTGKGLRGRYQNFDYQGLTEPTGGVFPAETAESNAQLSIGASLLSQASLIRQLNDGVNDVYSVSHDTVGLVFDDDTVATTVEPVLDIRTQISLTDPSHNATYRTAAIQSYTSALSMIETAVLDQVGNTSSATPNAVGVTTLFSEANDAGQKFYQVTSSSVWYSVKPYLTGYSSTEETDILGFLNAGHTLILPQNGSLTKGNYTGVAYQSFKSDTSFGHNLDDSVITNTSHLKGGLLAPVETSFIEEELNLAGPGGGSSYGSDLQINPAAAGAKTGSTDLVVGSGPYPFSLSFTRSFRPDTNDGTTGGWTHNFAITGKRTSDGSLALGDRYAIDAARAMVALYVGREVLKGGHTVERTVTSALIQNWLHKGLYNNIFKVSQGSDAIEFVALADGSYYAPEGQAASFTLSGTGSSTTATYTSKSGAAMTLTATDSTARDFRVTGQAWPSGMNVTMTYPTATRMMVANGLGRSLTIDMSADGKLITKVTDETNRYVDYTYAGLNISDAIMHQSPTGSSQSLMKYSYSGDLLTGTTPPVATTATTSFTHNALGQLTSITQTDRGTTNIYANHWRTEVVDPSGAKQITKNDPYGRWVKVIDDNGNESTTYFD